MIGGSLEGGVALVLGSAGALGRVIVERLDAAGHVVAGLDAVTTDDDRQRVVDLTDRAAVAAAVEEVRRELGPIEVLVVVPDKHDAAPIGEMARGRWQELLRAHLGVTTNACAAVVPAMVEAGSGTVVIMSSWLALAGMAGEAYQAAAAGTLLSFTKGFAMEVAPAGVRVNCVAVGPMASRDEDEAARGAADDTMLPLGRYATPQEIAETVAFLIREGDFYVGQIFEPSAGAVV